jgi:UDP-2-acetamido-3-amino-2,3-dideoxy-glucuronate N-acetyltransferase
MTEDLFIHPTATIDDGAKIGKGTKVWHYSHVMPNASIGEACILGQNVFVASNAIIGNGCKIQNNVSIYEGVVLEDEVFLGPSMVFTNVDVPRAFVERKNYLKTPVGKGATIGANATVVCGNSIGNYAFIGAGAVVNKNVPEYALMVGVPAKQIGWVSALGRRLEFDKNGFANCPESGQAYQLKEGRVHQLLDS